MLFELCRRRADARQTRQSVLKQFLVLLMVTIILVTPLVTRCAGSVMDSTSPSPTTSATLKTPKVLSAHPLATTPVHSVAVLNGNSSRGDPITVTFDIALILAAFITTSGAIIAALIGAFALVTAPLLNGAIPAALINGGSVITAYIIFGLIGLIPHPAPVPLPPRL